MLPPGLPDFQLPALRLRDVDGVIPLAFACFLLAYIEERVGGAQPRADDTATRSTRGRSCSALGAANVAAAFGQGYPVAGGLSQSSVNDKAGAKTPLALVFASVDDRPVPAVPDRAAAQPAQRGARRDRAGGGEGADQRPRAPRTWKLSRFEFGVAMVAFAGVLLLGILKGVMLAALVSLLLLIRRVAHPHVAFLGRIPGTQRLFGHGAQPRQRTGPAAC